MSAINLGNNIIRTSLAFDLDPTISAGFIKTPKKLTGCILWLDASDASTLTTEGAGYVRYWADKSDSKVVATGGGLTLANEPLLVSNSLNGLSTIYFDGTDYFEIPDNSALQTQNEKTVFVVYKYKKVSNTNYGVLIQRGSGDSSEEIRLAVINNANWIYFDIGAGGGPYIQPTGQDVNIRDYAANIVTATATRFAGSSTLKLYSNGKDMGGTTIGPTLTPSIGTYITSIGKQLDASVNYNYFTGNIAEIIVYNRCLSDTERNQIHNYLANKWRIPLLQTTLTNKDLIFNKLATCQNNNIPVIDKSYRVNPANATGSPLQSNFYFADSVSWMSSIITYTITLEAWVKPNSFTFYGSPGTDLGAIMIANSNFYLSIDGNGKFNIYLVGATTSTVNHLPSTTSVTKNIWNHVAITFDGAYIKWYLNGVLDKTSSSTYTLGVLTLTNYLGIGSEGAATFGRFLDGYVSGCRIYGRTLSSTEILQNYEQTKTTYSNLPNIVTSGLQLYLDADVYSSYIGSGTTWTDLSGNAYNGILTNGPAFSSTEPKCITFDGTNDYSLTTFASSANLINDPTTNSGLISFSIWVNVLSNTVGGYILSSGGQTSSTGMEIAYQNGSPEVYIKTTTKSWGQGISVSDFPLNTWINWTTTCDNTNMYIYKNGSLYSTTASSAVSVSSQFSTLSIGAPNNALNNYLGNFKLANVMFYNRTLSAAEVLQNYNATKFRFGL